MTLLERIERHSMPEPNTGCVLWFGADNGRGYGVILVGSRSDGSRRLTYAHRAAYEIARGPIPDGMHLDHLCRTPACINPDHLEPVTCRENLRRGVGHGSEPLCPAGHPYDGNNLYRDRRGRKCRTCNRERQASRKRRLRETRPKERT